MGLRATGHVRRSAGIPQPNDNALVESINGPDKAECMRTTVFHDGPFNTTAGVEYAHRRLGRLVQQPPSPLDQANVSPVELGASPLRCPQPGAATRRGTAKNLRRFTS